MSVALADLRGIPVVHVGGVLDLASVDDAVAVVRSTVSNSAMGLVVDLTETDHLDSAGLHFLFETARRLDRRQQELWVIVAPETLVEDLVMANDLGSYATVTGDVEQAVAHLLRAAG